MTVHGKKLAELRYGENPHQKSSIYLNKFNDKEIGFKKISGKNLSYNNYNDIFSGLEILNSLKKQVQLLLNTQIHLGYQ